MDICPLNNEEDTRPVAFVLSPQQIENVTGCRFQEEEAMRESLEEGRFKLNTSKENLKVDDLLFVLVTWSDFARKVKLKTVDIACGRYLVEFR